jgi:hypothetical protein
MSNDSDLLEERQTIVKRLLDAAFGRSALEQDQERGLVFRLGSIARRRAAAR